MSKQKRQGIFILLLTLTAAVVLITTYASDCFVADKDGITDFLPADYQTLELEREEIYRGNLVMVRAGMPCKMSETENLVSLYAVKDTSYQVKDTDVAVNRETAAALDAMLKEFAKSSGKRDVNVISGFRSVELQQQLFDEKKLQVGEEEVQRWIAQSGYSEHHSGYAVDLGIYRQGASITFDGKGKYRWLINRAHAYGFILRYAPEKESQTGFAGEAWHFRYVGEPHAFYMKQHDLCLEEYHALIKNYPYRSKHLKMSDSNGNSYEVYYVKAEQEVTPVPVPRTGEYSISGNNSDGFIVTAHLE